MRTIDRLTEGSISRCATADGEDADSVEETTCVDSGDPLRWQRHSCSRSAPARAVAARPRRVARRAPARRAQAVRAHRPRANPAPSTRPASREPSSCRAGRQAARRGRPSRRSSTHSRPSTRTSRSTTSQSRPTTRRRWPRSSAPTNHPTSSMSTRAWPRTGSTRASSRTSTRWPPSAASTRASSSRATSTRSRVQTARPTASRRTATRWRWPTTPTCSTAAGIEPPTTWDELKTAAEKLTAGGKQAFCLNHSLDRALAFVYQEGGSLLSEDKTENTIDSPEVKNALQTYLGFFKNGQGCPRGRPRRRLVRQGPRSGTGRDHLRGRLARSVHEAELPGREVRLGGDAAGSPRRRPSASRSATRSASIRRTRTPRGCCSRISPVPTA